MSEGISFEAGKQRADQAEKELKDTFVLNTQKFEEFVARGWIHYDMDTDLKTGDAVGIAEAAATGRTHEGVVAWASSEQGEKKGLIIEKRN